MDKNKKIETQDKVLKDSERREFLDKFGRLSAAVPVGMLVLMGPSQSRASASDGNDNAP